MLTSNGHCKLRHLKHRLLHETGYGMAFQLRHLWPCTCKKADHRPHAACLGSLYHARHQKDNESGRQIGKTDLQGIHQGWVKHSGIRQSRAAEPSRRCTPMPHHKILQYSKRQHHSGIHMPHLQARLANHVCFQTELRLGLVKRRQ